MPGIVHVKGYNRQRNHRSESVRAHVRGNGPTDRVGDGAVGAAFRPLQDALRQLGLSLNNAEQLRLALQRADLRSTFEQALNLLDGEQVLDIFSYLPRNAQDIVKKSLNQIATAGKDRAAFIAKAIDLGVADDLGIVDDFNTAFRNTADDYAQAIAQNAEDFAKAAAPALNPGRRFIRAAKRFTKAAPLIGGAIDIGLGLASGEDIPRAIVGGVGSTGGGFVGAQGGAILGATIGSAIPGVGTVIGGAAGGILGGVAGGFTGGYAADRIDERIRGRNSGKRK